MTTMDVDEDSDESSSELVDDDPSMTVNLTTLNFVNLNT